jgi:hypothetical protein
MAQLPEDRPPRGERPPPEDVEPLFAGLRGAGEAGDPPLYDETEGQQGPAADPWRRGHPSQTLDAGVASEGTRGEPEDEALGSNLGLFLKALLVVALLLGFSAAIYFVLGV